MASFWRPGYDPRRPTLPAIAEDAEEDNAAVPTTHSGAASSCPPPRDQDGRDQNTRPQAQDETGPGRTSAADAGPSGSESPRHSSTQRQEDASPSDQEPLTGKARLARRLARHPEFRPHPGTGHAEEEEVKLWLLGVMHVLAEVREGVKRLARRASDQPPVAREQLTYEDVERFVQLAAAEYQRRFGEPAGA